MRLSFVVFLIAVFGPVLFNEADAQEAKLFRIGFLSPAASASMAVRVERFKRGLEDFGYIDGKNTIMEYRWAEGVEDRLSGLASELAPKVDLIVAHWTQAARAAQQASATKPIVCFGCGDAVSIGLVASLARPVATLLDRPRLRRKQRGNGLS